jgi:hypothetical protein
MGVFDDVYAEESSSAGNAFDEIYSQEDDSLKGNAFDQVFAKEDTLKGGEKQNEEVISQPQAKLDSNAPREADKQKQPSSEAGIRTEQVRLPELKRKEQRVGNINASGQVEGGEQSSEEDTKTEGKRTQEGSQDGQGIRGQVPSGNQAEVSRDSQGASVPSVASKVVGAITSPLGYLSEEMYNSIAGLQRTIGMDKAAEDSVLTASTAVEDWAKTFGGEPIAKEGSGATAAKIGAAVLSLPSMALTGGVGMAAMVASGYGGMKENLYEKYKRDGLDDEEANKKSTTHAALTTAATIPAYLFMGNVAGKTADRFVSETTPKILEAAGRLGMNAVANASASAAIRGFSAGLEGENIMDAVKDVSLEGSIQDIFFAAHSTASHFKEQARIGKIKEGVQNAPDEMLKILAKDDRYSDFANEEIARREKERLGTEAESSGLPITASAVKSGDVIPEKVAEIPVDDHIKSAVEAGIPDEAASYFVNKQKEAGLNDDQIAARIAEFKDLNDRIDAAKKAKEPVKTEESVADEQVKEGFVRVYRGEYGGEPKQLSEWLQQGVKESGQQDAQGRWWTSDPEIAKWYAEDAGKEGKVVYQDIPKDTFDKSQVKGTKLERFSKDAENELFLPSEYVGKGKDTTQDLQAKPPAKSAIEAPEGARIASAAYIAPDGTTYTGKSHIKAMEAARDAGAITQKEINAKERPASRNTDEFGYKITLPNGKRKIVTREEGAAIARASGQAQEEPFTFGEKMHSNETAKDDYPESKGLAEAIHNRDVFQYGSDKVKLIGIQDDGVIGRVIRTNQEILLPKGTEGGHPKGIEGLELVKLGQQNKAPMSPKTKEALRRYLNDRVNPETNSILRGRKSEGGFIDLTALTPYLENIHDYGRAVYKKGMDFATWSARMIKDLGQGVVSALKKVYETISQGPYLKGKSFAGSVGSAGDEFAKRVEGKMKAKAPEGEPPPQEYYKTEPEWMQYDDKTKAEVKTIQEKRKDIIPDINKGKKPEEIGLMTEQEVINKIGKEEFDKIRDAYKGKINVKDPIKQGKLRKALKKIDMLTSDMKPLGIKIPKLESIYSGFDDATRTIADGWEGKTIPNLSRVGVKPQAVQLAHATAWVEPRINSILSEVFPDSYKNEEKMSETMDIMAKDDILGGYNATVKELESVNEELFKLIDDYQSGEAKRGAAGRIKELEEKADDLRDSRDAIAEAHNISKYKKDVEAAKGTEIEENINRWKEKVHPIQDELHSKWGDENTIPIENSGAVFGARINLLSKDQAQKIEDFHEDSEKQGKLPSMQVVNYRNPDVKQFKGVKKSQQYNSEYSTDAFNVLKNTFAPRVNDAAKIDLYDSLIKNGAAVIKDPGGTAPTFNGEEGRKFPVKMPVKNSSTGKTSVVERDMWVDPKIHNELMQLLDVNGRVSPLKMFSWVTQLQVLGIADGVAHLKNLHGVVNNALSGDPALKQIAKKIPFISSVVTISRIRSVMREIELDSPAIRKEIADLSMTAGLRSKFDQKGIVKYVSMHDLLHNVDTAARIIMGRNYDALVKKGIAVDTPEGKIDFISQVGEYNRKLMSRWQAVARDSGFSPFIVAGRAMNRNARRLLLADPGFEATSKKAAIETRVLQASGLVLAATMPALINMITTGSIGGRYGTPVGAIDFGPNADTKEGKRRILDLFALTGIRRGMRLLGLNAAIEGVKNGASLDEIQNNMKNDFTTTSLHPFIGPGVSLAWQTLKGERFDLRTGFQGVYSARQIGGYEQYLENLRVGLKQQQPLLYSAGGGALLEKAESMVKTKEYPKGIPAPSEETKSDIEYPSWLKPIAKPFETAAEVVASSVGYKATVSPALKLSAQLGIKLPYTPQQDLRYAIRKDILKAHKEGDDNKARQIFEKGVKDGILVRADLTTLEGKMKEPDLLVQRVKKLKTPQDALEVYRVASPEEQDSIIDEVMGKIQRSKSIVDERMVSLRDEMIAVTKKGSQSHKVLTEMGLIPVAKGK